MEDCLFCKIVAGEIPSNKVYEDDVCYAFYDIDPQAPTHFLVIPKQHIQSVAEIDSSNSAIVAHCLRSLRKLRQRKRWIVSVWFPTSESRRGRAYSICTSMYFPAVI